MKKSYVIIIDGVEQIGFTLSKNTFDGALDLVKEWKARGILEGKKIVIRTIIESDEEIVL